MKVTQALATEPLTAADRCDRCGARAYVRAIFPSGSCLLFCAHHARQHADALRSAAVEVHDETHLLDDVSPTAPDEER